MSEPDVREECPHCDAAPPSRQLDMHIARTHADLPPCTARIETEHRETYVCGFRAGHAKERGEYGAWHASKRDADMGRYIWNDTATGAIPHRDPDPSLSLDSLKTMGVISHAVVAAGDVMTEPVASLTGAGITEFTLVEPSTPNIVILAADNRTPLVTIHPSGELEYGPGYTPDEAARTFWDALQHLTPAAQLYEGEEPYTTEGVVPTPAQWIWKWNRATPARRLQVAEAAIRAQGAEQNCIFGDHAAAMEELREARLAIQNVRQLHRPVEHRGVTICAECSAWGGSSTDNSPINYQDCPTLKAIGAPELP
ncbi:hypothetical protein [Streptomyces turgidiscabies]|uniref:hypothetical protein n=1 Tax=Streptomyces turgidiscabies TaxID=85558 RepID=UPI0038F6674A